MYSGLSLVDFVQRLLAKRCVAFLGSWDSYLLLTGESGSGGFERVGSDRERPPLTLNKVLSYDEIKLSAFLSVSSRSEFLNDGNRENAGVPEKNKKKIVPEGIVTAIIGGRFERCNVMESEDVLITLEQNTLEKGYGLKDSSVLSRAERYRQLWNDFYEERDILYSDALKNIPKSDGRLYEGTYRDFIFDNVMMKKRYAISFDTLLLESQARAVAANKMAYVHVAGIGLGAWRFMDHQVKVFLETLSQRLRALVGQLTHIRAVHFARFPMSKWGDLKDGGVIESKDHPKGGIKTFLSSRNPAEKLPSKFKDCLLVVSFAWDGNALPGNEFWRGSLTDSGDPSTACSTLISELHNPHINREMVAGSNLHIATLEGEVMHIADYSKKLL